MKYEVIGDNLEVRIHFLKKDALKKCGGVLWSPEKKLWTAALGRDFLYKFCSTFNCWEDKVLADLYLKFCRDFKYSKDIVSQCKVLRDNSARKTFVDDLEVKFSLRGYQKVCVYAACGLKEFGLLLPPGTGKTKIVIDAFSYKLKQGQIRSMLVVCPKINVSRTWVKEFGKHCVVPVEVVPIIGDSKEKIAKLNNFNANTVGLVHIMNYSTMCLKLEYLQKYDMVVFDESRRLGNIQSKRTRAARTVALGAKCVIISTGTFNTLKSFSDVFAQFYVLDGGATFSANFTHFRATYFDDVGDLYPKWVMKPGALEEIGSLIYSKAITYDKDECLDLPGKTMIEVPVDLCKSQKLFMRGFLQMDLNIGKEESYFKQVLRENAVNVEDELKAIHDVIPIVKYSKLHQIACGHYKPLTGRSQNIELGSSKLETLRELLKDIDSSEKVIIWARFTKDVLMIKEYLGSISIKSCALIGSSNFDVVLDTWSKSSDVNILIGQEALGIGLNLVESHYVFYYSYNYSLDQWQQSLDRTYRIGQKFKVTYYILKTLGTVDEDILRVLKSNKSVSKKLSASQYKRIVKKLLEYEN